MWLFWNPFKFSLVEQLALITVSTDDTAEITSIRLLNDADCCFKEDFLETLFSLLELRSLV